ncbi:hypothetical protein NC651_019083 [Populus alba x Populus x berolinensis]|nr:hypothetical protein NC651_019083 [Populus alba x Populus x berolinensis]
MNGAVLLRWKEFLLLLKIFILLLMLTTSMLRLAPELRGTVFMTDNNGALVDITAKSSAYLPVQEASIHRIKRLEEAGIVPGMREEFVIIGENEADDSLILSLRSIQYELAWERCRQLQAEDVIVKGKVVGGNKGGLVAVVEGLRGFVPFSQISSKSTPEELLDKEFPLKFVDVDEEQSRLILSNRKAMADSQAQLGIGSVVTGNCSRASNHMVPSLILAESMAFFMSVRLAMIVFLILQQFFNLVILQGWLRRWPRQFRQRIAQAEAMARADMLRFQPESGLTLSSDGILSPLNSDLPAEGLDLSDVPPADKSDGTSEKESD